jgi:hypothetical protein
MIEMMVRDDRVVSGFALSVRALSITAFVRASLSGASYSTKWSENSKTTLR